MNRSRPDQFFNPYADDPQSFRRLTIRVQVIALFAVLGIAFVVVNKLAALTLAALLAVTILLSLAKIIWPAQIITPLSIIIISTIFMLEGSGTHDIAMIGLAAGIVIAGLFLGSRGLIGFATLAIAIFVAMSLAEMTGQFSPVVPMETLPEEPIIFALMLAGISLSLSALINRLRQIASQARTNELNQITANEELLQLKRSLETRVVERTADLERRAEQMETIASTARSITAMQELEQLLPSICRVVSEKFGFYHTGIFLLDERSEYAVLQAANSEGGQQMLQRGHRLRVGTTGIVGTVAGQGEARIALDVGADAVYFNNPDLPETRSEMALPLNIGSQTVGILDVQSKEIGAFKKEDIAVLGVLADQISVAIENARLFSQTKQALADSQTIYQQYVQQDWVHFSRSLKHKGYAYDGIKAAPLEAAPPSPPPHALTIPIKIRGLTIGSVTIRSNNPLRTWSQNEINLAQTAADRAGLGIENFRLLTEAQRRAAKERTISDITSRIGTSVDLRAIMQAAVEELGRVMPGSEVVLQFHEQKTPLVPLTGKAEKSNDD
jgi:GAF domain-containing protein